MRANTEITMTEHVAEVGHLSIPGAIDSAAARMAGFMLRLLSAYFVYCFGLPRENFEFVKEN
jgi:hypothetical protein